MSNSRRDPTIPKALADQLPRHLLILEVQYKIHSEPKPRIAVISGFAVAHRGLLFWITAAHCLESLKKLSTAAGLSLGPVRLHDQFPHPAAQAIPIDLDSMLQYAFGDPDTDVGISLPRHMIQDLVAANPQLKPLKFESTAPDGFKHHCYCIAGLPTEFQKPVIIDSREHWLTNWSGKVLCITSHLDVKEGDAHFPEGNKARPGCMYGLIDTKNVVNDIDGMSGGPVFEVMQHGEQWHWRLAGVQSSWFRDLQIVCIARAELLRAMADLICDRIPGALPKNSP